MPRDMAVERPDAGVVLLPLEDLIEVERDGLAGVLSRGMCIDG